MEKETHIVLALYPNAVGLGYACIEVPKKLREYGVIRVMPIMNEQIQNRVQKFIEFYKPHIVVIRDSETMVPRIQELCESITQLATEKNIPVHRYTRQQVRDVFELFGVTTKYEIAQKIITWFPELDSRAPKIRKLWLTEDYNMGIFDALALALTYEYLNQ